MFRDVHEATFSEIRSIYPIVTDKIEFETEELPSDSLAWPQPWEALPGDPLVPLPDDAQAMFNMFGTPFHQLPSFRRISGIDRYQADYVVHQSKATTGELLKLYGVNVPRLWIRLYKSSHDRIYWIRLTKDTITVVMQYDNTRINMIYNDPAALHYIPILCTDNKHERRKCVLSAIRALLSYVGLDTCLNNDHWLDWITCG